MAKRFTFAMAKEEIKDLKAQLEAANVKLDDNVVTQAELKWLRVYKLGFLSLFAFNVTQLLLWLF